MKDFKGTRGMLVKYSAHYRRQHSTQRWDVIGKRIGVIVETHVYQENGVLVTYPEVAWEGGTRSTCHPMNVTPYRRGVRLPPLGT